VLVDFSCPGGAGKGSEVEKAGSGVERGERPVMERRGGSTLPWCQEPGCGVAKERRDQGGTWAKSDC